MITGSGQWARLRACFGAYAAMYMYPRPHLHVGVWGRDYNSRDVDRTIAAKLLIFMASVNNLNQWLCERIHVKLRNNTIIILAITRCLVNITGSRDLTRYSFARLLSLEELSVNKRMLTMVVHCQLYNIIGKY